MTFVYGVVGLLIGGFIGAIIPFALFPGQGGVFGVAGAVVGVMIRKKAERDEISAASFKNELAEDDAHHELAEWSNAFRLQNGRRPTPEEQVAYILEKDNDPG